MKHIEYSSNSYANSSVSGESPVYIIVTLLVSCISCINLNFPVSFFLLTNHLFPYDDLEGFKTPELAFKFINSRTLFFNTVEKWVWFMIPRYKRNFFYFY
ncbi:hypothetical protein AYI69_g9310 [Smittium culicis]|uniref:Uncharacterized protein n=1 Tax=Smittium culicis TaxID=133412 RepID=A0A1R1XDI2_9FUNG|nr:hypothetical protein AYI69_g9310 [Smittium culicis]